MINELHRSVRQNNKRRKVILKGIDDLIVADLVEMIPYAKINREYKYILVLINDFPEFVWCVPIKNKTGKEVTKAMERILLKNKFKAKTLQTDIGREFYNADFK